MRELPGIAGPLLRSFLRPGGGSLHERLAGMRFVLSTIRAAWRDPRRYSTNDPVLRAQTALMSNPARLKELDDRIEAEISAILAAALNEVTA
jgi:hypothetical protein